MTHIRLYVPIYSLTLLLSAFLLFLVQPLFGKMILPLLGGSPSVWNTAMVFFQCLLLAGYAYAHFAARYLVVRLQGFLHIILLAIFTVVLPLTVPESWAIPPADKDPTLWQLGLMTIAVGGPFFVLSASAPLLQHWFSHSGHKDADNPYFLYAASNLGSMTALLAYPFFIEPALNLTDQSQFWSYGYYALVAAFTVSFALISRHTQKMKLIMPVPANDDSPVTMKQQFMWLLLAFVPSSLMLGLTTFMTTDLASVPLLWILPLALYVGTFIIAFARRPVPSRPATLKIQGILLIFMLAMVASYVAVEKPFQIVLHLLLFFFTALMCHHELAALRPPARHLTKFYLVMSLGGALGGAFNALLAPQLFTVPVEYAIVLALACFMRHASDPAKSFSEALAFLKEKISSEGKFIFGSGIGYVLITGILCLAAMSFFNHRSVALIVVLAIAFIYPLLLERRWVLGLCALVVLAFNPPGYVWAGVVFSDVLHHDRNFFGVIRVVEKNDGVRSLLHGTTIHGDQPVAKQYHLEKLSYYSPASGVSDAFAMASELLPAGQSQKIAVLGLGIGVTACYAHPGRHFDFYDIDPGVIDVAEDKRYFTYLSDCGSPYSIIRGDARLTIKEQPDKSYDLILMDAFSSDNIPVHLITAEALKLYTSKLRDGGFIVMNISNRYLDLKPVAAAAAQELGVTAMRKFAPDGKLKESKLPYKPSEFVVFTANENYKSFLSDKGWTELAPDPEIRLWTDQYSNIVSVLKALR